MTRAEVCLSLAAGLVGGGISHYLFAPRAVEAQGPPAARPPAAAEMRSQSFTLVDQNGAAAGRFYVDLSGRPHLEVNDRGRTVSLYPEAAGMRPITGIQR